MSWDYRSTILLNKKIKIKRYLLNDKNVYKSLKKNYEKNIY